MHKLYKNNIIPNHNTSLLSDKVHLTSGVAKYLFEYKDSWYLVKSQQNYSSVWIIHALINKTTKKNLSIKYINGRRQTLSKFTTTIDKLLNIKVGAPLYARVSFKTEWEEYVIPIIKRHIDAAGL